MYTCMYVACYHLHCLPRSTTVSDPSWLTIVSSTSRLEGEQIAYRTCNNEWLLQLVCCFSPTVYSLSCRNAHYLIMPACYRKQSKTYGQIAYNTCNSEWLLLLLNCVFITWSIYSLHVSFSSLLLIPSTSFSLLSSYLFVPRVQKCTHVTVNYLNLMVKYTCS